MAKASYSSTEAVCTPVVDIVSDIAEHCVQLTKEQYSALCELRNDPLFKKAILVPASCPSWEKLMAGKTPRRCFTWVVYHYWLGSLKFALQSKCVEHGEQLYGQVFTIFEELLAKMDNDAFVICPPRKRPYSVLDTDGVEFSHRSVEQATIGSQSAAYRHELRRSVAYIGEQMELKGDRVDWESLYVEAIATDHYEPHNLLSTLSKSVDDFIKKGRELLQTHI